MDGGYDGREGWKGYGNEEREGILQTHYTAQSEQGVSDARQTHIIPTPCLSLFRRRDTQSFAFFLFFFSALGIHYITLGSIGGLLVKFNHNDTNEYARFHRQLTTLLSLMMIL